MRRLQSDWQFDGYKVLEGRHSIILDGEDIVDVLPQDEADQKYGHIEPETFEGCTIMPGMVNCHAHVIMPGDGSEAEVMFGRANEILLLQGYTNALKSLASGVTTLADFGDRDDITFHLREAIECGAAIGPRMILSGRPLTIPEGHAWNMNGVVRNEAEARALAREVFSKGADVLKIMASGGGTAGSDPYNPQFPVSILEACVEEAREAGKPTAAHTSNIQCIREVIEAGFDIVAHGSFHDSEGNLVGLDPVSAEMALERGVYWNPTLAVARSGIRHMEKTGTGDPEVLAEKKAKWARRAEGVRQMYEMGIPVIAGSDEGFGTYAFGGHWLELEALVDAGIPEDAVLSGTTILPARALGMDHLVGSLESGKKADLMIVAGKPFEDITLTAKAERVILAGEDVDLGETFLDFE